MCGFIIDCYADWSSSRKQIAYLIYDHIRTKQAHFLLLFSDSSSSSDKESCSSLLASGFFDNFRFMFSTACLSDENKTKF